MADRKGSGIGRRDFLKTAGLGAGALAVGGSLGAAGPEEASSTPARLDAPALHLGGAHPEVVVVGAGAFGVWTALKLRELGARVTLVDLYGPGNSRSTSGDETRGVRTSYANRDQWCSWASMAIERWKAFDAEWGPTMGSPLFYTTGDLLMREAWDDSLEQVRLTFERNGIQYEVLDADELRYRWPQISGEGVGTALHEVNAGVVRSRDACQRVSDVFLRKGGSLRIGRAALGESAGGRLQNVTIEPGEPLSAEHFVFALGPWLPKAFPDLMGERIRISTMGHVYYFGTPPGDNRFAFPNLPSFGMSGYTGWPTLPPDNRGLRIRTGGSQADDPDTSVRWIPEEHHERVRATLAERFPAMAEQPLVETRACHYEGSSTRNWFVDLHPGFENVWIAGGGSAEGFKFGPMLGDLIAGRVLGLGLHPEVDQEFRFRDDDVSMTPHPGEPLIWETRA